MIEFNINNSEIVFGSTKVREIPFATLECSGEGFTIAEGEAKLPIISRMVEIPQNANPEIVVTSVFWEYTSLDELNLPKRIVPVQPSVSKNNEEVEFVLNENYYSKTEFMQTDIAHVVETGEIRGHRFAFVEISPVQYDPSSGELKIMTACNLRIDLPDGDMIKTSEKIERYLSPSFENLFKKLFINYNNNGWNMGNLGDSPKNLEGYLIITYDNFYDEILPFASWKASIGYEVTVTNTSQIPGGPTKENIHNYIEDAYDNWIIPPSYVLLVGDTPQIPTYTGTTSSPGTANAVDLYYVTMDDYDYFPDIFIGRFPASLESHVTAMVNKTIFYEQGNFPSNDWIKKATFMAGNDHFTLTEATHNYVIANYFDPNSYSCDKLYEVTYGATTQNVKNALNNGRSLAVFSGHGGTYSWADGPSFSQSDVRGLTNQYMYPFVCSHACITGTFTAGECFGETWLREPNKAAIAFWGASESTYWNEDDILEKKMFYAWWTDNLETIGGMTDMGLYYLYQYYNGGGYTKYYFEAYNVLGDPSLKIWRDDPNPDNPPVISNVTAIPSVQNVGGWVNISCNVFDGESGVNIVKANVSYPDGTFVNHTMLSVYGDDPETKMYYYNTTYFTPATYGFSIWANDTNNTQNNNGGYWFVVGILSDITDLSSDWNFVSLPFNQSVDKGDLILYENGTFYNWSEAIDPANGPLIDMFIFGWNRGPSGQTYHSVDTLEPGYGYWLYVYSGCQLLAKNVDATYSSSVGDIGEKWNIIGVPCNQSVDKTDLIIHYNGTGYNWSEAINPANGPLIGSFIFGWNRGLSGQTYQSADTLEPGYSYWMYAYYPCALKR